MKAARIHKSGGPDVLVYEDVADPTPMDGEVLIRIEAVGLNFADVMRRRGDDYPDPSPPPFILGAKALDAMAPFGQMVFLGQSSGKSALIDPWAAHGSEPHRDWLLHRRLPRLPGSDAGHAGRDHWIHHDRKAVASSGHSSAAFAAADAHRLLEGRKTTGKVVLQPWADA